MVKDDLPTGFENTKDALYTHIKLLWGMIKKEAIPTIPNPTQLSIFSQLFSNPEQVESAITNDAPPLVPLDTIETLRGLQGQRTKVGKHFLNLSNFLIWYMQVSLSKLGIIRWAPNVFEQPDSLYNEACRISALKTFRQLANFHKEEKEKGATQKKRERGLLQKGRERLQDIRYKFAVSNDFPKRYQQILKTTQAYSDEEYCSNRKAHVAQRLPFQSQEANIFMCKLDKKIKDSNNVEGTISNQRQRLRLKDPPITSFPKSPKGLPIDFYNTMWFNSKLPAQRRNLADIVSVAFVKDPRESLEFKDDSEKLGDRSFTHKNWDRATKKYNLDFLSMQETDSDDESSNEESDYGESIDIESSAQEDNDEDKIERGKSRLKKQKVKKECQAMKLNLTAMLWKLIPLGK
ncbi:hypothetical protein O181_100007, partial [Austropuccinia psidii MF-1]|nr:hypothetical protein [Austropuccinia psidii MF-1]